MANGNEGVNIGYPTFKRVACRIPNVTLISLVWSRMNKVSLFLTLTNYLHFIKMISMTVRMKILRDSVGECDWFDGDDMFNLEENTGYRRYIR